MNQKIEELMYHSGLTAQGCWDEMDDYDHAAIEKLVVLTIQACANYMQEYYPHSFYEAVYMKKHFGVD